MFEPWQPPVYEQAWIRPGYTDYVCPRCGSFVENIIQHNNHHRALDRLRDGILALTRIIVPGAPEGQLLEYLPDLPIQIHVEDGNAANGPE